MDEKKNIETWSDAERYIAENLVSQNRLWAAEVAGQAKTSAKRWFIAWLITLAALVATNGAWLYAWQSYEYVSQDGNGINTINTGNQGDVTNEPDSND